MMRAYGRSKLCNILFTRELARRLEGAGVVAMCLHPGVVATGFGQRGGVVELGWRLAKPFMISPEKGAETSVFLATVPTQPRSTAATSSIRGWSAPTRRRSTTAWRAGYGTRARASSTCKPIATATPPSDGEKLRRATSGASLALFQREIGDPIAAEGADVHLVTDLQPDSRVSKFGIAGLRRHRPQAHRRCIPSVDAPGLGAARRFALKQPNTSFAETFCPATISWPSGAQRRLSTRKPTGSISRFAVAGCRVAAGQLPCCPRRRHKSIYRRARPQCRYRPTFYCRERG